LTLTQLANFGELASDLFQLLADPRSHNSIPPPTVQRILDGIPLTCYHSAIFWGKQLNEGNIMAQVLVRQLPDQVVARLKKRAKEHGRSLQAEVKTILEEAALDYEQAWKRIDALRAKLKQSSKTFGDSADLIREDRDR
jgi:plasmid stability protein